MVRYVVGTEISQPASLPAPYGDVPGPETTRYMHHHIAAKAPAAWNAQRAIPFGGFFAPTTVVKDNFGGDAPLNYPSHGNFAQPPEGPYDAHGYHVLGIVSGEHSSDAQDTSDRAKVAGTFPGRPPLLVYDGQRQFPSVTLLAVALMETPGNRVVNISMENRAEMTAGWRHEQARLYIEAIRTGAFFNPVYLTSSEDRILHVVAAGNFAGAPAIDSSYWAQTVVGVVTDNEVGLQMDPLLGFVVENRGPSISDIELGCRDPSSSIGGNISAVGMAVESYTGPVLDDFGPGLRAVVPKSGSSMAAAQVTGLATYIWALAPSLTAEQVISIINKTSVKVQTSGEDQTCDNNEPNMIDAYAAVLAVDSPTAAPVRRAILDVSGATEGTPDDDFDERDLELYAEAYAAAGAGSTRDFSKFDLNGDGYTGGGKLDRFDLDMDGAWQKEVPTSFGPLLDENDLTDGEILCYYAFSGMYTGGVSQRNLLLEDICPKRIVYTLHDSGSPLSDVWLMSAFGEDKKLIAQDADGGQLSPDRQRIAYVQSYGFQIDEIYTIKADGSGPSRFIASGAFPSWSPDGKWIAFFDNNSLKKKYLDDLSLPTITVASGGFNPFWSPGLHWSPDSQELYYTETVPSVVTGEQLVLLQSESGTIGRTVLPFGVSAASPWKVTPDGGTAVLITVSGIPPAGTGNYEILALDLTTDSAEATAIRTGAVAFYTEGHASHDGIAHCPQNFTEVSGGCCTDWAYNEADGSCGTSVKPYGGYWRFSERFGRPLITPDGTSLVYTFSQRSPADHHGAGLFETRVRKLDGSYDESLFGGTVSRLESSERFLFILDDDIWLGFASGNPINLTNDVTEENFSATLPFEHP